MGLFSGWQSAVSSAAQIIANLVGQDIVARSISLTQAASSIAVQLVTGARLKLGGGTTDYLESNGATQITAAGALGVTGDINLANVATSSVRGGAGQLRLDDAIGSRLFYTGSTFLLDGNATLTNTAGTFTVAGDPTSPVRPAFAITPQDAQPTGANAVGDMYVTTAGVLKICTAAGTPGTWISVGAQV